jgi:hypothetical protein
MSGIVSEDYIERILTDFNTILLTVLSFYVKGFRQFLLDAGIRKILCALPLLLRVANASTLLYTPEFCIWCL